MTLSANSLSAKAEQILAKAKSSSSPSKIGQADLVGQFQSIKLPDTVKFGDNGKVTIKVTNRGNAIAHGPIRIKLWNSTDQKIDSNDGLLSNVITNINLQSGQSTSIDINYSNNTSVIAPGSYQLIAQIDADQAIAESNETNNIATQFVSAPKTDMVIDWNAAALNAIQAEGVAGRGIPPTTGSRLLAIMSTAVYDAVNAFNPTHKPYLINLPSAPNNASVQAAAVGAAYGVLSKLLPHQTSLLQQQLMQCLQEIKDNLFAEMKGLAFGYQVAQQAIAARLGDGSANNTPYVPPAGNYVWKPGSDGVAVGPNWGSVKPFGLSTSVLNSLNASLSLDNTPTGNSARYAQEIEEVRLLGGAQNTALTTLTRTPDQTQIAYFWAYDRADTFRPYGHLNQLTEIVATEAGNSLAENARLFAQLNVALADAGVVAWGAKYRFIQPRPDDVIAEGIARDDGIASTIHDPNWRPLLGPTPPFPDYISGHSTFGAAWAGVMNHFFGEDYVFTGVSQELQGVTRDFTFTEAAIEDALSRIYGGIHIREATVTDATPVGFAIGNYVAEHLLTPQVFPS